VTDVSGSVLTVRLLGALSVRRDQCLVPGLDGRKVQELLGYLLLHRGKPQPREGLAALLWGEADDSRARKYLRQALWQLHTAVDAARPPHAALLRIGMESVTLDGAAGLWLDVDQLERACALVQDRPGASLDSCAARPLHAAVELYQGDLLEGWYCDWCLEERERLQTLFLGALYKLMAYCEAHGEYEAGLAYGARILRCDHARERAHRGLMRLHYLAGDRTAALRQYERCVAILREELDVAPTRRTLELYEQIRSDRLEAALGRSGSEPEPPPATANAERATSGLDTAPSLHRLLSAVDDLEVRVQLVQQNVASIRQIVSRQV
jgi:DNA-binding SARP family transcriptional activator